MKRNILILLIFFSANLFAQNERFDFLDYQLRKGDFNALIELAEYFDSKTELTEYLGYHIINTNETNLAKRLIRENSMFLDSEIIIDSTTTSAHFKKFLNKNKRNITFSNLANAFLITPFDKRKTDFEIIEITDFKWNNLNAKRKHLLNLDWVKANKIDSLVNSRNPLALLKIASVLLKNRYRFDEHYDNEELVDLIQLLTKSQIAVPNESGDLSYHLDKDFYERSKINLVIFFANNYKKYEWDESFKAFRNDKLNIKEVDKEKTLFEMLSSENDTIAQNAFISLTKLDAQKVSDMSDQYRNARVSNNYILPSFEFRFLKQLVYLTSYCKEKNIDFEGNEILKSQIELLKTKLTFNERRQLEDKLIKNLTLNNITAFEYWSLIYEKSWSLTYSAGRILDKFYSQNWKELTNNQEHLETYLLKSRLFDDLGIIGFCNNYLVKFRGSSQQVIESIQNLSSTNQKVQGQLEKALEVAKISLEFKEKEKKTWNGNTSKEIKNFNKSYSEITNKENDSKEQKKEISSLLSQINYGQIGEALLAIENLTIKPSYKYSFMARDFGFSYVGKFEDNKIRETFLENYQKLTEIELYKYYLKQMGVDFTNSSNELDLDKIYEILKYDINTAFVGGGGSTKDNGTYSIIKILELTFKTTLGYPNKLCCSNNMYSCNSRDRAIEWMNYLDVNNHLKSEHNEPVSFAYE
ncbi:hypothetical protein [uncultured Psychroserpens sp.]|uniref:hypothetical protein n=1 Tax=uncultured Psychroserpens sp. TaxID=255436 RepID=UPI0026168374|nr:hypothetical protein [uncultured Psychroserpens sp.]